MQNRTAYRSRSGGNKARKTYKRGNNKPHVMRNKETISPQVERDIVCTFLRIQHTIKLFHWRTTSYATHKATDDLHSQLSGNIDTFVEVMLGKNTHGQRVDLRSMKTMPLHDCVDVEHLKRDLKDFIQFLLDLNKHLDASCHSDLLNIRDEMLGHLNQFLYLLTFK